MPLIYQALYYIGLSIVLLAFFTPLAYSGLIWAEVVVMPVLNIVTKNDTVYNVVPYLGMGLSSFGLVMITFIPGSKRTLLLELSHRNFHIGTTDVAEAYYQVHTADRAGAFKLPSEFEGIRERFEYLRSLPDFENAEPEILTLAAQMSYVNRAVAVAFNDDTVARANDFIAQRKHELTRVEERLESARGLLLRVRQEATALALAEQVQDSQLSRFMTEICEQLAPLGFQIIKKQNTVVEFPMASPAE